MTNATSVDSPYAFGIETHDPFGSDSFYLSRDEVLHQWLVKPFAADAFTVNSSMLVPLPAGYYLWDEILFNAENGLPEGLASLKEAEDCVRVSVGSPFDDKAQVVVLAMEPVSGEDFDASGLPEEFAYSITEY